MLRLFSKAFLLKASITKVPIEGICYYLSDDYESFLKIEGRFKPRGDFRMLGSEFHLSVEEISKPFLELSHVINVKNQSEAFWGTALANRNSAMCALLQRLVYYHAAKKIIDKNGNRVSFITDSGALIKLLEQEAQKRKIACDIRVLKSEKLAPFRLWSLLFLKALYFLVTTLVLCVTSRFYRNKRITAKDKTPKYLVQSWITIGSFKKNGTYQDRNFGPLLDDLQKDAKNVWVLPLCFNMGKNFFKPIKQMANSSTQFIIPEQYLSWLDVVKALREGVKTLFLDLSGCFFEGMNVKALIQETHWSVSMRPSSLSRNTLIFLLKKLSDRKIQFDRVIYAFENNPSEKLLILGIRRHFANTQIIGFQHTVWLKEQLGVVLLPEELTTHPMPDKIICSGKRYLELLEKSGFPGSKLLLGPNLRYQIDNTNFGVRSLRQSSDLKIILVILNYETNHCLELLKKVGECLKNEPGISIALKAHPVNPLKKIKHFLNLINFPKHEWVTGRVQDWVQKASLVLMTGGSVSTLETMVAGVPLIRISLENNFDFDCLWESNPYLPFVTTSKEIKKCFDKAFSLSEVERQGLRVFGSEIKSNYFEPVTPLNLKIFSRLLA